MRVGTALFHAYAHNWACQLEYNPRLNAGWGKTNGEGMERVWWKLAPLVSLLRYATKQHRLVSLDLWTTHRNEVLRTNAGIVPDLQMIWIGLALAEICLGGSKVASLVSQTKKYKAELAQADTTLASLLQVEETHSYNYFEAQWERQREIQLRAMSENAKARRARLEVLIQLEEELIDAW